MNILFLIGLLSTQGFGYSNQHTLAASAELRASNIRAYVEVAPTHKIDAGDGFSVIGRVSYRLQRGEGFYFQPGVEVSHQHTSQYGKSGYFAVARGGISTDDGWDIYAVGYVPLSGNGRYAVGGGYELWHYSGFTGTAEITIGPKITDGVHTTRQARGLVMFGWRF